MQRALSEKVLVKEIRCKFWWSSAEVMDREYKKLDAPECVPRKLGGGKEVIGFLPGRKRMACGAQVEGSSV